MKLCSVAQCRRPIHSRGWCRRHYMSWWRYGDPLIELHARRGDGRGRREVRVCVPGHPGGNSSGCVKRARLVVEKAIGRYLKPTEIVHHVDEDSTNDRNDNLVACENQSYHMFLHYRMRLYRAGKLAA